MRYLIPLVGILLSGGLACATLIPGGEPTAEVAANATPTLAATIPPTPTPEPLVLTLTALAVDATAPNALTSAAVTPNSANGNQGSDGEDSISNGGDGAGGNGNGDNNSSNSSNSSAASAACPAPADNLLRNPGFEGAYQPFGAVEVNHATGWIPWWTDSGGNFRPEYKPIDAATYPNRVHGGSIAQVYFKSFGQFRAGLYQILPGTVSVGRRVQFSAFGQAWSCEEFNQCPGATSVNPANMLMRVGLDPFGGTAPDGDDVIWSGYFNPLDRWEVKCVEAVVAAERLTVFLWASPDGPRQNQDVYWDDAALVILP